MASLRPSIALLAVALASCGELLGAAESTAPVPDDGGKPADPAEGGPGDGGDAGTGFCAARRDFCRTFEEPHAALGQEFNTGGALTVGPPGFSAPNALVSDCSMNQKAITLWSVGDSDGGAGRFEMMLFVEELTETGGGRPDIAIITFAGEWVLLIHLERGAAMGPLLGEYYKTSPPEGPTGVMARVGTWRRGMWSRVAFELHDDGVYSEGGFALLLAKPQGVFGTTLGLALGINFSPDSRSVMRYDDVAFTRP